MKKNVTKIALLLIAAVLLLTVCAGVASADYTLKGSGSEADPYQISTALDLYNMSQNTSYFQGGTETKHFKLMKDISISNITSVKSNYDAKTITIHASDKPSQVYSWKDKAFTQSNWDPGFDESVASLGLTTWPTIGTSTNKVTANISFDGGDHTISGLFINASAANQGLFGYIDNAAAAVNITNLTLRDSFVYSSNEYVGGLVGCIYEGTLNLTNNHISGSAIIGLGNVGGIVGSTVSSKKFPGLNCTYCSIDTSAIYGTGDSKGNVGGLIGCAQYASSSSEINNCKVMYCTVTGVFNHLGGIAGYIAIPMSDCTVTHCTISLIPAKKGCNDMGGIAGYIKTTNYYLTRCNVIDCNLTDEINTLPDKYILNVGGLVGSDSVTKSSTYTDCSVLNSNLSFGNSETIGGVIGSTTGCTISRCKVSGCNVSTNSESVGGLIGMVTGPTEIKDSQVVNCEKISGTYDVGGLIGGRTKAILTLMDNSLKNLVITATGELTQKSTCGGLIGASVYMPKESDTLKNNTLEDVRINVLKGDAQYAYLFDVYNTKARITTYPINSSNGIARLAEINLPDNNRIINSYIQNETFGKENTVIEGFTLFPAASEFNITVSNPKVTAIADNAFSGKKLTGLFNISSITSFGAGSLGTASLTGGFYLPKSASVDSAAFTGADNLQIIYGSSIEGLPTAPALINITEDGILTDFKPGSFTPAQSNGNTFETVKLGNNYANKFKNLTSGEYLNATESWTAGNAYLAVWNGTVISFAYNDGSGKTISANATVNNGTLNPAVPSPTRSGYTFLGWYNESTGGEQIVNTTGSLIAGVAGYTDADGNWINENPGMTLYAQWKEKVLHTVTVTTDGQGTAYANKSSGYSGESVELTQSAGSGYEFKEWKILSGDIVITDDTFTIGDYNVVIKAVFKETGGAEPVTGSINGTITWPTPDKPTNAIIKLLPTTQNITVTDFTNPTYLYEFDKVEPGVYNIEVTYEFSDGAVRTANILADNTQSPYTITGADITLPEKKLDSAVIVDEKAAEFEVKADGVVNESKAQAEVRSGVTSLVVTLVVTDEKEAADIKAQISQDFSKQGLTVSENIQPLNATVLLTVNGGDPISLSTTITLFELYTAFNKTDKENVCVYGTHAGTTSKLEEAGSTPTTGTYRIGDDGIHIYTNNFSDYTVAYTDKKSPSPTPYTPSHSKQTGSTVILKDGEIAPTPTPTPAGNSTIKPTTLPTQSTTSKSPAPFVGLVLGLGAAALLMRMRR